MRARVEPRKTPLQGLHLQLPVAEERLVHRGDFQLAACRRFYRLGHPDHFVGVEIESYDRVVGFRMRGLLLDREAVARRVELRDAVPLGVLDAVSEDGRLGLLLGVPHRFAEHPRESRSVEDVVTQHQAHRVVADELLADQERLRQSVGRGLLGIGEPHAVIRTVAQQAAERRQVGWCRDDEYVPDAGEHQRRQRVIDHRFVVDREQLFADPLGYRIEARSRASRQDNAFHIVAC